MSPEQYQRLGELFEEMRQLPARDSEALVAARTEGAPELREALLRLLAADRRASSGDFLGQGGLEDAAALLLREQPALPAVGAVFGSYRLSRRIGAGGMGVVYEADDLRLKRPVALKVLPHSLLGESRERSLRFQQEARAIALLNHPNIVAIYDTGTHEGFDYIAMELVDGQTLRQMLEGQPRGVEAKTLVDVTMQCAAALSAAHSAGIVHRDIKPENIIVRPDGFVKVVDFGLAKLREEDRAKADASVFRTRPGDVTGTVHYLSPEQVSGRAVDARSDLFSLGVVAYELATGERPFDGPTDGAVFNAILNERAAAPSARRPSLTAELDALVLQALEKEPELRFQSASDFRSACLRLTRDSRSPVSIAAPVVAPRLKARTIWAAAALVLAAAGIAALARWIPARADSERRQPYSFTRLTDGPGEETFPNLSADNQQFVYTSTAAGAWDVYWQRTGGATPINLTGASGQDNTQPSLSPDASRIVFRSERDGGGLFLMESTGENLRRLTKRGYLPAWSPDGRYVVFSKGTFVHPTARMGPEAGLSVVDTVDGAERDLDCGDAVQPSWSPHGQRIAYWGLRGNYRRDILTIAANGEGKPVSVTDDAALDWNPVWSPSGRYLYFLSDRGGSMNVWRVEIDEKSGKLLGEPEPVTVPASYVGGVSVARNGSGLVYSQASQRIVLRRVPLDAARTRVTGPVETISVGAKGVSNFSFSPDGSKIVYDTIGSEENENLWVMDSDGSHRKKLTVGAFLDRTPMWSPSGDTVLFFSNRAGLYQCWTIQADGSALRKLTDFAAPVQRSIWSPDGRRVIAAMGPRMPVLFSTTQGGGIKDAVAAPGIDVAELNFADWLGDWIVGLRLTPGKTRELVFYDAARGRLERTGAGMLSQTVAWLEPPRADSRRAVFAEAGDIHIYDAIAKTSKPLLATGRDRIQCLRMNPREPYLYFSVVVRDADLWLARFP